MNACRPLSTPCCGTCHPQVSSQRDAERADIQKEIEEHNKGPDAQAAELEELIRIFEKRGITRELAEQVSTAGSSSIPGKPRVFRCR